MGNINKYIVVIFLTITSLLPNLSLAGQQQGGEISKFDIQPRIISSTNASVTASIDIKIYPNEFVSYCGNKTNVSYGLFLATTGVGDRATASWTVVPTPGQIFEKKITVPLTSVSAGGWYVLLYCGPALQTANDIWLSGGQMSKTSNIDIQVYSSSDFTFGCVAADGKYSCSPGAKPDCSDVTASCGGRTCSKIQPKSLCGKSSTTIVMGCIASDGKYACSNGTTSNCSDVQVCAGKSCIQINPPSLCGTSGSGGGVPGTTQTSTFTVPNWLRGEPKDLVSLLDIIAKWLFNLAIPVAVGLIIYAGVLLMTAGANPAYVKKGGNILKWVAIGLAIIFINKGFISLIRSILELGNS